MRFERDYFIHYYDSDPNRNATISSIMKYFEDIAILHSEHVNLGIDYYIKNHVVWMLYKWDIKIIKLPKFQDTIKVRTTATSMKSLHAFRYYDVLNDKNETIITANTMWLFINTDTKRPIKISDEMFDGFDVDKNKQEGLELGEIGKFKNSDAEKEFNIRFSDIDTNKHVNNIAYVEWALETVPEEIMKNYFLSRLKVSYRKEIGYGSRINSSVSIEKGINTVECVHLIKSGETILCMLETNWRE